MHDLKNILVPHVKLNGFMREVMLKEGVRPDVVGHVVDGLVQTSLRGVDSHGVRLMAHYLNAVKGGRINPDPEYKFEKTSMSTGIFDADHTFGHAAGMEAARKAVELAKEAGTGHVAVRNSSHFGAAAYYALEIARNDMIGMTFTNTDALIRSYGGKTPFFGNNPICITAPHNGEEPFCLDMATSVVTFNKVRQLAEQGLEAPNGVGADKDGIQTTDSRKISMLLPVGGYKGYGLSMAVEILCSLLTGMPYGPYIPKMFEAPISEKRFLGHFVSAIRIDCFQDKNVFKDRLSRMIGEVRGQVPLDKDAPVMVAGDPENRTFKERSGKGVPLAIHEYETFKRISEEYGVKMDF